MKMLGKKMGSVMKLAKKVKVKSTGDCEASQYEYLLRDNEEGTSPTCTPTGFLALYVGEERQRFVVPTGYLSHPLFRMLLEKAYNEFGFEQTNGIVVPCSVAAFQEAASAVECCHDGAGLVELAVGIAGIFYIGSKALDLGLTSEVMTLPGNVPVMISIRDAYALGIGQAGILLIAKYMAKSTRIRSTISRV